jgi:hypothetical protein
MFFPGTLDISKKYLFILEVGNEHEFGLSIIGKSNIGKLNKKTKGLKQDNMPTSGKGTRKNSKHSCGK